MVGHVTLCTVGVVAVSLLPMLWRARRTLFVAASADEPARVGAGATEHE